MNKIFKKQFKALFKKDFKIGDSYAIKKMFRPRLRYPINMFADMLTDIIFSDLKKEQIQSKYLELYRRTQNRTHPYKLSMMDFYGFIKFLRLKEINEIRKNRHVFEELEFDQKNIFIYDYINWIIVNYYYDHKDITENWNNEYQKKVEWRSSSKPTTSLIDPYEKETFIQNTISKSKIRKVDFSAIRNDVRVKSFSKNQDKLNKIEQIGEEIVYNILQKKFGNKNVTWLRGISDKTSPYDIKYKDQKDNEYYVEVKSTSALKDCIFFLSRNEYEFYTQNKNYYKMIFVSNISFNREQIALIRELDKVNIKLSLKKYGYDGTNNLLYLTPSEFKGLVTT